MAMSSGSRQALGMAVGWLLVSASVAVSLTYYGELKALLRAALRLPDPAVSQIARHDRGQRPAVSSRAHSSNGSVEIKAGAHGHYYATAEINGRPVDVLVDSGASIVALTFEDARRSGVHVRDGDFTSFVSTANGVARVAPVTLDRVSIGHITVRAVRAAVAEQGKLGKTLLGMSFLNRLQRVDMRSGILILQE